MLLRPSICIIDDNPTALARLRQVFERAGYGVHGFVDSFEALQVLPRLRVDLMLLDFNLRGANALSVLGELRASSLVPGLPVVVHTGLDLDAYRAEVLRAGAVGLVDRGSTDEELVLRVGNLVALRRACLEAAPALAG